MHKMFCFLLMITCLISSCVANQIKETEKEKLKDKLDSNFGIERIVIFNEEGQLIDLLNKPTININESSCIILWTNKINQKIVLEKKGEEVLIKEIIFNKYNMICIQGISISDIRKKLKIEDFEIIQNRYTCGIFVVGDMIENKNIFVLVGDLKENKKSGQNLILLILECGENGELGLLKKFYYYWPKEQQYNLGLSYNIKKKIIGIDEVESEGSIEIKFNNGKFEDKFIE